MTDTRIMLASGALFDLTDPEGSEFTLADIAHGLGNVCRFAGHVSNFYSVAEHCVHVARMVPVEHGRAALLHDAAEAFIGDVTRPLKALLPEYQEIEKRIERAICDRFLMDEPEDAIHHPRIKAADIAMCCAEARVLMPETDGYWHDQAAAVKEHSPFDWDRAISTRLSLDKPQFASAKWLRALNRYGHMELDQPEREAA